MAIRLRYVLVGLVVAAAAAWGYLVTVRLHTDWLWFELGARSLVQHAGYDYPPLHMYVENPGLQVGPPPLVLVAAFESLSFRTTRMIFVVVMAGLGLWSLASIESVSRRLRPARLTAWSAGLLWVVAVIAFAGLWGYQTAAWGHLDDALALSLAAGAAAAVARRKPWWVVGLMLGTSAAAKPWALVLAPLVFGLPRLDRARAALVLIGVAGLWWLPFVLAEPGTVSALGHTDLVVKPTAVPALFGLSGVDVQQWLRPTQFAVGLMVGSLVALRTSWTAAPLAALATRVGTDPFTFGYYGLGPLLFAMLWDVTRQSPTLRPWYTVSTLLALFAVPALGVSAVVEGTVRLAWVLAVLTTIIVRRPETASDPESRVRRVARRREATA